MFFKIFAAIILALPCLANAVVCFYTSKELNQIDWPSLRVSAGEHEIVAIGVETLEPDFRKLIIAMLTNINMKFSDISPRAERILRGHQDLLANHAAVLLYLHGVLEHGQISYVVADVKPEDVAETEALAKHLYLEAFQLQLRSAPADVSLDRLILMAVGVPFYLKAAEPRLFEHATLEGLPDLMLKARDDSSDSPRSQAHADAAFERLKEKLSSSRQSLHTAEEVHRRIRKGEYARLSAEDAREKILGMFWRPAQGPVREWLKVELTDKRAPERESKSEREREPKPERESKRGRVAAKAKTFAEALLEHDGKGVVFLSAEKYARLENELHRLCDGQ